MLQCCLRSLNAELGDRVLQVLEQIVEVLKVLPQQIASQLKGWGYVERFSERFQGSRLSTCPSRKSLSLSRCSSGCVADEMVFPVSQFVEELEQNRTPELVVDGSVPQIGCGARPASRP